MPVLVSKIKLKTSHLETVIRKKEEIAWVDRHRFWGANAFVPPIKALK